MGLNLHYDKGQTPLDEDEKEDLLIPTIATRTELDEFEQANILDAIEWSTRLKPDIPQILNISFLRELHRRMFSEVWAWAGSFRQTNKNMGVDKYLVEQELHKLLQDGKFWIEHQVYPADEIAVRLKHRTVSIHPFPNGNGRHSRIYSDIIVSKGLRRPVFSWGGKEINHPGEARNIYLKALKAADEGDYRPLIEFARSGSPT